MPSPKAKPAPASFEAPSHQPYAALLEAMTLLVEQDFFVPYFARRGHGHGSANRRQAARAVPIDLKETSKTFELAADLPGVAKEDIKLHVDGNVLSVAVEKQASQNQGEIQEEEVKYHRTERTTHFVKRSIRLPESVDMAKITAKCQDGVLRVEIPKQENQVAPPRTIAIE